ENPTDIADRLRASVVFGALPDEAADALAATTEIRHFEDGEIVLAEGSDPAVFVVLDGTLKAVERDLKGEGRTVRTLGPGESVDEVQILAGAARPIAVRAEGTAIVARVPGTAADALARAYPPFAAARARLYRRQLLCRLFPMLGPFDRAFLDEVETMADWLSLPRGQNLVREDEGAVYLVVNGRVQTLRTENGVAKIVEEAGRGETMGELTFLHDATPGDEVRAARDSVLVAFTGEEFERLIAMRPSILRHIARYLGRGRGSRKGKMAGSGVTNVAIVGVEPGAPAAALAERLVAALAAFGPTLHLTAATVDRMSEEEGLAETPQGAPTEPALLAWLEAREASHRFVVYEADPATETDGATPWTRRSVNQADRVLFVARAGTDPQQTKLEEALNEGADIGTHDVLVLVHPDGDKLPSGTARWLDARPRVEEHVHVRWDRDNDVERLARTLAGQAVGVALGGGGARGFAHIGILKALEEAGIPVDAIGGTSMGAAVAAQRAMDWTPVQIQEGCRKVFVEIQPHRRFTLPIFSVVKNDEAQRCGQMLYGTTDVEDCWIPFFCISSNLSTASVYVHRRGPLAKATLASASLPAFAPPIIEGDNLLVDGGVLNNVPADVMRDLGCGTVLASEVSIEEDDTFRGDRVPSPWEAVRGKLRRRAPMKFPSLLEVAMRSSMLHSISQARSVMDDADFCFHAPIDKYTMMDFPLIEEIIATGYTYGREALDGWEGRPGTPAEDKKSAAPLSIPDPTLPAPEATATA
ncbi:MAG TPA: cyclic nucleotide-binding and patatin-like phospholipase domain-containing protein, partial [Rhodothermales bacterium]|nr:cyclic nucleotide-binding and patatin-like phospholipase domain-containing protein [Rhodothermales bacterium]